MPSSRLLDVLRAGLPAFAYFYTVGTVGFWLPLFAESLGMSYTGIQLLATVYFLFITPSTLLAGIAADVTGRPDLIIVAGMLANAASTALMPHLTGTYELLALRAVQGLSLATSIPVALGSLSLTLGVVGGVTATLMFSGLGMVTGSVTGGYLLSRYGFAPIFYVAAAISVAAGLLALGWRPGIVVRRENIVEALKRLPAPVAVVVGALVARNFFASGVFATMSILFSDVKGLGPVETGFAMAVNPAFQVAMSLVLGSLVLGRELYLYSLGLAATGLVFQLYLHASGLQGILLAQAVLGTFYAMVMVSGNTYIINRAPREIRYTASSLYGFAFNLGWVLGTPVAGAFMDRYSLEAWVALASFGCAAAGLLALAAKTLDARRSEAGGPGPGGDVGYTGQGEGVDGGGQP